MYYVFTNKMFSIKLNNLIKVIKVNTPIVALWRFLSKSLNVDWKSSGGLSQHRKGDKNFKYFLTLWIRTEKYSWATYEHLDALKMRKN